MDKFVELILPTLFYDRISDTYFTSTVAEIKAAEERVNNVIPKDRVTRTYMQFVDDLRIELGLPSILECGYWPTKERPWDGRLLDVKFYLRLRNDGIPFLELLIPTQEEDEDL